jgi:propionyl-CoA synthetase
MKQILNCYNYLKLNSNQIRFLSRYNTEYKQSIEDPIEFWKSKANLIEWHKKPEQIFVKNPPFDRYDISFYCYIIKRYFFYNILSSWYTGGLVNASYNCLDIHCETGFSNQTAIIHDSPLTNKTEKISFKELLDEVTLLNFH